MNMKQGLFQQQTLKLTMTHELSQAIALLQYCSQDLVSFLENKATENPLISLDSQGTVSDFKTKNKKQREADPKYWIEQIGEVKVSLENYLLSQIPQNSLKDNQKKIIRNLIYNLDENGYLRASIIDLANNLGESVTAVEEVLRIIQSLEPAGVGARDLQECLLLQIERKDCSAITYKVLKNYFIEFAEKKWKVISKELGISMKEIQDIFDFVQTLHPRPCGIFSNEKPSYVVPDVSIEIVEDHFIIRMANDPISTLNFNQNYYNEMKSVNDKQVNSFLKDKYNEYQWILKSVQQRRETIYKVMSKIAEKQPECIQKGLSYLKPMTMKEVADELEIHESTVSRTVKDKYVQAPFGTVEMREFFSASLQSLTNDDVSAKEAKSAIQALIQAENKKKPLSDQEIADTLNKEKHIVLSRRTVAKYRDQLKIPSSSKRKRF